jgi:pyruvate/2-oxoglutarate/acetoin dehydrogenase E1 component
MPELTVVEAVNLALARALADDPNVVVSGEDVGSTAACSARPSGCSSVSARNA